MSETKRKNFSGEFKAKVALEAIRGVKTVNQIAQEFGVHPTQVGMWKKELQEQASSLFDAKRGPKPADPSASPERLYSEIGRLKMELDWLKKSLGSASRKPQAMGQHCRTIGADPAMRTGGCQPLHGLCAAHGSKTGRAGIDVTGAD
jgi:transposase-like protein